ncbi:MAG: DUF4440 domain-containing protein [Alphaproteobacteria bacterium]|nr:DUF4440 domain-containing protein [Alphaproteobacteria bacterium]
MATKKKAAPAAKKAAAKKPSAASAVKAANNALAAALATGDAGAVAAKYTKNAIVMAHGAPAQKGTKAIKAFWGGAIGMGIKGVTLRSTEVEDHGTTLIECGAYTLKGDGGAVADVGKYIVIWKREGGAWKLHRDIFNSDKAA